MRIDSHRVRLSQPGEVGRSIRKDCRDAPVRAVHMEPEIELSGQSSELGQRIDGSRTDRTGSAYYQEGSVASFQIADNLTSQALKVHPLLVIHCDPADRIRTQTGDVRGLLNPGMCLLGAVNP